ncbi:hypothetical protein FJT64_007995 [Amphibalanus amphitrite]|uniref:Uncharacterized protein n=1 Tax=Amphibalanus amphitrite TaxID=1232801 RepID=A0A6A4VWM6_AMPAM|nr:hypothetical protein FJT64_007995 [Amphibalanus amphitrite]
MPDAPDPWEDDALEPDSDDPEGDGPEDLTVALLQADTIPAGGSRSQSTAPAPQPAQVSSCRLPSVEELSEMDLDNQPGPSDQPQTGGMVARPPHRALPTGAPSSPTRRRRKRAASTSPTERQQPPMAASAGPSNADDYVSHFENR